MRMLLRSLSFLLLVFPRPSVASPGLFPGRSVIVGIDATAIAVGDLNGDSRPDLIVSDIGRQKVSVWHQLCDGTFKQAQEWSIRTSYVRSFVRLVDLDSDGLLDAVFDDYPVGYALGQPGGTFGESQVLDGCFFGSYSTVADLDHNGLHDIVVNNEDTGSQIAIYFQDAHLRFSGPHFATTTHARPSYHLVTDVNRDGYPDLLVTTEGCYPSCGANDPPPLPGCSCDYLIGSIDLFSNFQHTSLPSPISLALFPQPREIVAADLNHDGHLDLVAAMEISPQLVPLSNGNIAVALAREDGSYESLRFLVNEFEEIVSEGLNLYDATGDGVPDILHGGFNHIFVRAGVGDGTFLPPKRIPFAAESPKQISIADLNNDQRDDILVNGGGLVGISIAYGSPSGGFHTPSHYDPQPALHPLQKHPLRGVLFEDFYNTGRPGLFIIPLNDHPLYAQFTPQGLIVTHTFEELGHIDGAHVIDINRDGLIDLIVTVFKEVLIALNRGSYFQIQPFASFAGTDGLPHPTTTDWNADGWNDVAIALAAGQGPTPTLLAVYENRAGVLHECSRQEISPDDIAVQGADIDRDGKGDLAAVTRGQSYRIYFSNGNCSFETLEILDSTAHADSDIGDVDANGLLDLISTRFDYDTVSIDLKIQYNEGNRRFSSYTYSVPYTSETSVTVSDFDHDGLPDLHLTGLSDIAVLFGRPGRTFTSPEHYLSGQPFAPSLVEDFNLDGHADLLNYGTSVGLAVSNGTGSNGLDPELSLRAARTDIHLGEHVRLRAGLVGGREPTSFDLYLLRLDPHGKLLFRENGVWIETARPVLSGITVASCQRITEQQILDDPISMSSAPGTYWYFALLTDPSTSRILDWKEVAIQVQPQ